MQRPAGLLVSTECRLLPRVYVMEEWPATMCGSEPHRADVWVIAACSTYQNLCMRILDNHSYHVIRFGSDRKEGHPCYEASEEGFRLAGRQLTRFMFQYAGDPLV